MLGQFEDPDSKSADISLADRYWAASGTEGEDPHLSPRQGLPARGGSKWRPHSFAASLPPIS